MRGKSTMSQQQAARTEQIAVAQELSGRLRDAACAGRSDLWNDGEERVQRARVWDTQLSAAQPLLACCSRCPVQDVCRVWAVADRYTGVAGGQLWVEGVAVQELESAA